MKREGLRNTSSHRIILKSVTDATIINNGRQYREPFINLQTMCSMGCREGSILRKQATINFLTKNSSNTCAMGLQ
jgi:hypothetical protein